MDYKEKLNSILKRNDKEKEERPPTTVVMGVRGSSDSKIETKVANPGKVDESKWDKAKKVVEKEYGKDKWPVVTSVYEKMGCTFERKK